MDLNIAESGVFQKCFQLIAAVYGHTADNLRPLLILVRVATALVADEKGSAELQHPINLPKTLRQIRPEVDRFKSGDRVKPVRGKNNPLYAALPYGAASTTDCRCVVPACLFHADGRIIDALHHTLRAFFQQLPDIGPAAAATVQHLGI